MIIALLVIFGFDLIVLEVPHAFVLGRKRRRTRQPGVLAKECRVIAVGGFRPKWTRGCGRWVRDDPYRVSGPFRPAQAGRV